MVMPNLYGDILTDEAAQIQGGVGTAGSANIGKQYAMFEAIHGSAPRMVEEGRAEYADPSSIIKGGGDAPEPHREDGKLEAAGICVGHMHAIREENCHHWPTFRSERRTVRAIPHGDAIR